LSRPNDSGSDVRPLAGRDGEAIIEEPWQAEVLALAHALIEAGRIDRAAWAEALGAALKEAEGKGAADSSETYYLAALSALEGLVTARGLLSDGQIAARKSAWEAAYEATPHGQPVRLKQL